MAASSTTEGVENSYTLVVDAVRRFSRSIELCDDYLRGYYGLKVVCLHCYVLQGKA
jgi:ER membrane protein complex subunit 2